MSGKPRRNPKQKLCWLALAPFAGVLGAASASAEDVTWTAANASWGTAANWTYNSDSTTHAAPGAADNAYVNANDATATTVTYNGTTGSSPFTSTISGLYIGGNDAVNFQSVNGNTSLTVSQSLGNGGLLTINGGASANDRTGFLNFQGTGQIFNTGTITIKASGGGHGRSASFSMLADGNTNNGTINLIGGSSNDGNSANNATFTLTPPGAFTNNGTIALSSVAIANATGGNPAKLAFSTTSTSAISVTITGAGTIALNDTALNRVDLGSGTGSQITVVLDSQQTLSGAGLIGTKIQLTNRGVIKANSANNMLRLDPGTDALSTGTVNIAATGRLIAENGGDTATGGLSLAGGTFINVGVVEARAHSFVNIGAASTTTFQATTASTGDIRGSGTFNMAGGAGTLTITSGSLTPGDSAGDAVGAVSGIGALSVSGHLSLSSSAKLNVQLGAGSTSGSDYDTINISGDLKLDGTLAIDPNTLDGTMGHTYRLMTYGGTLTDQVLNAPDIGWYTFTVDASAGHVDLTVLPEPASLGLLAGGLVVLRGRRRRRHTVMPG